MLVRCSLKNYVLRNTAVIIVYGEPMELPRCGAEKICGQVATVTGWGDTGADGSPASTLQEVDVLVESNDKCNDYYPGKIKE